VPVRTKSASGRETYVLTLRPLPRVDGIRALRALLKVMLRRFGLKAIKVTEQRLEIATHRPEL
jgi:hypothetical protein